MTELNIEKRQLTALLRKNPCMDYDGYHVDIIDTQTFCDVMMAYGEKAGKPIIKWAAETAKRLDSFLDECGDEISETFYNQCDSELTDSLDYLVKKVKEVL